MGRRRSGEMPRVAVVKPHNHARVRIGGRSPDYGYGVWCPLAFGAWCWSTAGGGTTRS